MSYLFSFEKLNVWVDSKELNFLKEEDYPNIRPEIEKISNKLNALRKITIRWLNKSTD